MVRRAAVVIRASPYPGLGSVMAKNYPPARKISYSILILRVRATVEVAAVFQYHMRAQEGEIMMDISKSDVHRLCKEVSEEDEDSPRLQTLLNELLQVLEERQLVTLLL